MASTWALSAEQDVTAPLKLSSLPVGRIRRWANDTVFLADVGITCVHDQQEEVQVIPESVCRSPYCFDFVVYPFERTCSNTILCVIGNAIKIFDLAEECRDIRSRNSSQTNGEELIRKNNILGIRGEVLGGFQSVRTYSLPVLTDMLNRGFSPDQAGSVALLALIANVTDTNVIKRSSLERSRELRQLCAGILEQQRLPDEKVLLELDTMMTAENISPGGCADLLGVTFFFYFLASYMEKTADSA